MTASTLWATTWWGRDSDIRTNGQIGSMAMRYPQVKKVVEDTSWLHTGPGQQSLCHPADDTVSSRQHMKDTSRVARGCCSRIKFEDLVHQTYQLQRACDNIITRLLPVAEETAAQLSKSQPITKYRLQDLEDVLMPLPIKATSEHLLPSPSWQMLHNKRRGVWTTQLPHSNLSLGVGDPLINWWIWWRGGPVSENSNFTAMVDKDLACLRSWVSCL